MYKIVRSENKLRVHTNIKKKFALYISLLVFFKFKHLQINPFLPVYNILLLLFELFRFISALQSNENFHIFHVTKRIRYLMDVLLLFKFNCY